MEENSNQKKSVGGSALDQSEERVNVPAPDTIGAIHQRLQERQKTGIFPHVTPEYYLIYSLFLSYSLFTYCIRIKVYCLREKSHKCETVSLMSKM